VSWALVAGALANRPQNAGGAWVRLSWALGLRQLGFDVVFVEQIAPGMCVDRAGQRASFADSANLAWFRQVTEAHGLGGHATLVVGSGERTHGHTYAELIELAGAAELLVNISGHLTLEPVLRGPRRRAYVDLDPGFTQIWHERDAHVVGGHDAYFTVGANVGRRGCPIPTGDIRWRRVRQPVVLEDWPVAGAGEPSRFTTVASWRGPYGPLPDRGRRLGLKVHEFRKFWSLPQRAPQQFELALEIDRADARDRDELTARRWTVVDPALVAATTESFRDYVTSSGGEFSVAKGIYVETASGWFSDRTVRYLAAGRPALVQDTGFTRELPADAGLLAFRTLGEAIAGARSIERDYTAHRRAARELAETFFDSRKVLTSFVDELDSVR